MRGTLIECALALLVVAILAPSLIWWAGTIVALFTGERPW